MSFDPASAAARGVRVQRWGNVGQDGFSYIAVANG
jgi:hypothetical protein